MDLDSLFEIFKCKEHKDVEYIKLLAKNIIEQLQKGSFHASAEIGCANGKVHSKVTTEGSIPLDVLGNQVVRIIKWGLEESQRMQTEKNMKGESNGSNCEQ